MMNNYGKISAKQPKGVTAENWLPINKDDLEINMILRIYVPDLEKWKPGVHLWPLNYDEIRLQQVV